MFVSHVLPRMSLPSLLVVGVLAVVGNQCVFSAEYQWSVPMGEGRAFLWIPGDCRRVRAVVVGQNNMLEEGILAHPVLRKTLTELGIAEVWVAPPFEFAFDFNQGAGKRFTEMMAALAKESGYSELQTAPAIPIGHSACASYPWNFAAWNPAGTLAILSIHGDAPLTNMTGSGRPNPDWGERNIDGVPGLMVMGEYEWLEGRIAPLVEFHKKHPNAPLAMLPEPGRGHFDCSDNLVTFLAMFIRKCAQQRLPVGANDDSPLRPIDPSKGWRAQRWQLNQPRKVRPAPMGKYLGDPNDAFWCFDEEMAMATQNYFADQPGKLPQLLGFVQDGQVVPQTQTHQQVTLRFLPLDDGISFRLGTMFLDKVEGGSSNLTRWTYLPVGSPLGHAAGGGPIVLSRITGPITRTGDDTFSIRFSRVASTGDRRAYDVWLLASHPGDGKYKSAVQQATLRLQRNTEGADQHITFPPIPDQKAGTATVKLSATSDANVPVYYYVREGPAEVEGDTLRFTLIPPRSAFPVKVTVVAWQWGRSTERKLKTAEPVERTFSIVK